jgi:hypothetical protein
MPPYSQFPTFAVVTTQQPVNVHTSACFHWVAIYEGHVQLERCMLIHNIVTKKERLQREGLYRRTDSSSSVGAQARRDRMLELLEWRWADLLYRSSLVGMGVCEPGVWMGREKWAWRLEMESAGKRSGGDRLTYRGTSLTRVVLYGLSPGLMIWRCHCWALSRGKCGRVGSRDARDSIVSQCG